MPSHEVYAGERVVAILDHRPLIPGHCLVMPRTHYETLLDVPEAELGPLFEVVQKLGRAFEQALGADGSFVAVNNRVSQSVPHVHVHVVPRRNRDGLFARGLVWKRRPYADEAAAVEMRERIRQGLKQ